MKVKVKGRQKGGKIKKNKHSTATPSRVSVRRGAIVRNALQRSLLICSINLPSDITYIKYSNKIRKIKKRKTKPERNR